MLTKHSDAELTSTVSGPVSPTPVPLYTVMTTQTPDTVRLSAQNQVNRRACFSYSGIQVVIQVVSDLE